MAMLERTTMLAALEGLVNRTIASKLEWSKSAEADDEYFATVGRFVYFTRSRDGDSAPPYEVEYYRQVEGEEQLLPLGILATSSVSTVEARARNADIERCYNLAKASAWGVTGLDEDILADLNSDD